MLLSNKTDKFRQIVWAINFFVILIHKCPFCDIIQSMKVIRNLEITAEEFFHAVLDELIEEIEKTDKKRFERSDFKTGFQYVHCAEDAYKRVDFEIVDYQEGSFYKCERTTINGVSTLSYEVTPTETGISVTFFQETVFRKEGKKPNKIVSIIGEINSLGRMTDKLYAIQRRVINEKEGMVESKSNNVFLPDIRKAK